eukprot:8127285-Pyramimonas_sp.AAC.1
MTYVAPLPKALGAPYSGIGGACELRDPPPLAVSLSGLLTTKKLAAGEKVEKGRFYIVREGNVKINYTDRNTESYHDKPVMAGIRSSDAMLHPRDRMLQKFCFFGDRELLHGETGLFFNAGDEGERRE